MLQSVIRYSTPPVGGNGNIPVFADSDFGAGDTGAGAREPSIKDQKTQRISVTSIEIPEDLQHPALRPRSAPGFRAQSGGSTTKNLRRPSRPVSRDSAGNWRATQPDHDFLLAVTGYLSQSHSRPDFNENGKPVVTANTLSGAVAPGSQPQQPPIDSWQGLREGWRFVSPMNVQEDSHNSPVNHAERFSRSNHAPLNIVGSGKSSPPVKWTLERASDASHEAQTSPPTRRNRERQVISVGDVPVVLRREHSVERTSVRQQAIDTDAARRTCEADLLPDEPPATHALEHQENVEDQRRLAYETELIGAGDVSPISNRSFEAQDHSAANKPEKINPSTTVWFAKSDLQLPQAEVKSAEKSQGFSNAAPELDARKKFDSQPGKIALPSETRVEHALGGLAPDPQAAHADLDDNQTRRVSAMPLQVVHAVEEYAASSSSLASWDHDHIVANRRSGISEIVEMKDESELVTPIAAPVPRIVQNGPQEAGKTSDIPNSEKRNMSALNGYFPGHVTSSHPVQQPSQLQASNNDLTVPERSRSILSQISAMVSDDGMTLSPASSNAGRSTPSTIRRMHVDNSSRAPFTPAQIPEESTTPWDDRTPTGKDDDFDLYADHNGIVKDLHDESGRPVRVSDAHGPDSMKQQSMRPGTSAPGSRDGEKPRHSTERPMSFISGPPDELGKPQDQINQFGPPSDVRIPPIPERHRSEFQQSQLPQPIGVAYSSSPHTAAESQDRSSSAPHGVNRMEPPREISNITHPLGQGDGAQHTSNRYERAYEQSTTVPRTLEGSTSHTQVPINIQSPNQYAHDSRTGGSPSKQGAIANLPGGVTTPDQGYQGQSQPGGPRNQYEYHQQMMQRQAGVAAAQDVHVPSYNPQAQVQSNEQIRPQNQPQAKPRLSSVFKGLGGKSHQHTSEAATSSQAKPLPAEPYRNTSVQSGISSISSAPTNRPSGLPSLPVSYTHPRGLEAQSGFNSAIRGAAPAQSVHAHNAPNSSVSSTPSQGYPPRQFPQSAPMQNGQAQHLPTLTGPEATKKKRFSALGALFSRAGSAGDGLLAKSKVSKEEKKAQKGQRYPAAHSPAVQRPPQQQQFRPQQPNLAYYPPGQFPPHIQSTASQSATAPPMSKMYPPGSETLPSQRPAQQYPPPQPRGHEDRFESESAYMRTKQLAEEHHAQRGYSPSNASNSRPDMQTSRMSLPQSPPHVSKTSWGSPPGGYYKPDAKQPIADQGAYAATLAAQQQLEHQDPRGNSRQTQPYVPSQAERMLAQEHRQQRAAESGAYRSPHVEQHPVQQHQQHPMFKGAYAAQAGRDQSQQERGRVISDFEAALRVQSRMPPPIRGSNNSEHSPEQRLQASEQQQHHQSANMPSSLDHRRVSAPAPNHATQTGPTNSPMSEPRYEAPPIPAAYSHVSGAFISPQDHYQQHSPVATPYSDQSGQQYADPRMSSISPQISAQSQPPPNNRTHSDASTVSVVSPIAHPHDLSSSSPPPGQRLQQPRMNSISEVGLQDRPWHLNFPEGATEQEIVRARQRQYMEEQFTTQQQLHRTGHSPSPQTSHSDQVTPQPQVGVGGGFREVLPRTSPQPYPTSSPTRTSHQETQISQDPQPVQPVQPAPVHPGHAPHPAAYPLPMSPDPANIASPVNPIASALAPPPPPKVPHSPMRPVFNNSISPHDQGEQHMSRMSQQHGTPSPPHDQRYAPPSQGDIPYEQSEHDEPPPSYDGPGVPHDGMDKGHPERTRPQDITTGNTITMPGRQKDPRQRQASIGILQHPQPASMAASPQRSSADMGAESLRRQLLQQEDLARMERIQRAQIQRAESEREKQERDAARARARELERSASGGGQVGSLRIVGGSRNGGAPGWERRGSSSRPVFELPAVEDDEPNMKATSYPGQEWVPPMWQDD